MTDPNRISAFSPITEAAATDSLVIVDVPNVPGGTKRIDASNLNINLVITAAEITAGVTPTNLLFEPGDVRRYGAIGDGITDDTTAIQNAIDVAAVNGGTVEVPAGTYGISLSLEKPHNAWLRGEGADYTIIKALSGYSETDDAHIATHANYGKRGMVNINTSDGYSTSVSGITIDGNGNAEVGLKDYISVSAIFIDVFVNGCTTAGTWLIGSQNCTFISLNCEKNTGTGLIIDGGAGNNQFIKCEFQQFLDGAAYVMKIAQQVPRIFPGPPSLDSQPLNNMFLNCIWERNTAATTALILHSAGLETEFVSCNIATRSGFSTELAVSITKDVTVEPTAVNSIIKFRGCNFTTGNSAGGSVLTLVGANGVELLSCTTTSQPIFANIDDDSVLFDQGANAFGTHSTAIWNPTGALTVPLLVKSRRVFSGQIMLADVNAHEAYSVLQEGDSNTRCAIRGDGALAFGSGAANHDVLMGRTAANVWGSKAAGDGLSVGNNAANTNTPSGATAEDIEIFDETGASIGFIPVYAARW